MKIWVLNHYAANMYLDQAGRHQSLAKYLLDMGCDVDIFCANTVHNSDVLIDTQGAEYVSKIGADDVRYTFIQTMPYHSNGRQRIGNMLDYYRKIKKVLLNKANGFGRPDIIIASSVHPLTLLAGEKIARKLNVPCICEIRDLWPETLVELDIINKDNFFTKLMYAGEKHIYKKADGIVFTMPGGKKYIEDKGWDNKIDLDKVYHVSNGVDLIKFWEDEERYKIYDPDLDKTDCFKVIYAGSVRAANKVEDFISIAEQLQGTTVCFLIYGDGDQRRKLEKEVKRKNLKNIIFKGRVDKKYIPYILSRGDMNIVTDEANKLGKYGVSWNKIFEYMASGKPVVVNYDMGQFNLVEDNNFGWAKIYESVEEFSSAVKRMMELPEKEYKAFCENAEKAAHIYDYKKLAKDYQEILKETIRRYCDRN